MYTDEISEDRSMSTKNSCYHEVKKLGCGTLFLFLMTEFTFYVFFKGPKWNLELYIPTLLSSKNISKTQQTYPETEVVNAIYNLSTSFSDVFDIHGNIRIHPNSSTIFAAPSNSYPGNMTASWISRPYARKYDNIKFEPIREWTIHVPPSPQFPSCNRRYNVPAILFSTGAFAWNYFHSFSDILIPLYQTSLEYNTSVVFLITHYHPVWATKFKEILEKLSRYEVVNIDNEKEVLCFPRMIVGLKSSQEFGINPNIDPHYSNKKFRQFLRTTYSLKRQTVNNCQGRNPRMLIISRKRPPRHIVNEREVVKMARRVGFDVVVQETGWDVQLVANTVNSMDVLMGVHGSGLTNMVFLPENATVVQIIPFGLDSASHDFFQKPAKAMGFRYIEYKVKVNESSLFGKYPDGNLIYTDPTAFQKKGWHHSKLFLDQQLNLNLRMFKQTLLKAIKDFSC